MCHRFSVLALSLLPAVGACSRAPDPTLVEALTNNVWHARVEVDEAIRRVCYQEGGDLVNEIRDENGAFHDAVHWIDDGRHKTEIPITGLEITGREIVIVRTAGNQFNRLGPAILKVLEQHLAPGVNPTS